MAELHPQLKKDCLVVGRFPLCHLLLMRDANYPWCILVPDREGVSEIYELCEEDQIRLLRESSYLSRCLAKAFNADKMNIAALGNVVSQLHVHHVVRHYGDPAWPAPVWGKVNPKVYSEDALAETLNRLQAALTQDFVSEL